MAVDFCHVPIIFEEDGTYLYVASAETEFKTLYFERVDFARLLYQAHVGKHQLRLRRRNHHGRLPKLRRRRNRR